MSEKILSVKELSVNFITDNGILKAVRNINFDLYKGETFCIVGESGSGKSVTSKAIMRILANNAILADGEIIYDGKDLLEIPEEEMVKLRGDKIAMIFQDPMSSLNPIVKIGHQLTEAMLLKNKTSRKNARKNFNSKLKLLNENMNIAFGESRNEQNEALCKTFDAFSINSLKLENKYNEIHRHTEELLLEIDDFIFLIEKKQKVNVKGHLRFFVKELPESVHPDIVVMNTEMTALYNALKADVSAAKASVIPEGCMDRLRELRDILQKAVNRPKPNYFTLGYFTLKHPETNVDGMPVDELNAMCRKFLDDDFMNGFIEVSSKAVENSNERSLKAKRALLPELESALEFFAKDEIDRKKAAELSASLSKKVDEAIDKLKMHKNSAEYVFSSSLKGALRKYFAGIKHNPVEQKRYDEQMKKYEALIARGRKPDWKVMPAVLVDLGLAKKAIIKPIENLIESIKDDIAETVQFDAKAETVNIIDYLKEQASALVYKVTPKMAKARALKLMEEVGIPEPSIRYKQYPFEFSGGMRQRIVIAIALAANPDILICDEPTTALDVTIQSQILELINKLKKERNLSVIFITHDLGVVANMADRIGVMYAGKIVEYGTADDIFYRPAHPYTWALLASMPDLDTDEKLDAIPGTPPNMIFPPKGDAFASRNKYAMKIDYEAQPPMFKITEQHYAATWLLHPDAPKVEPPKQVRDRIANFKKL